MAMSASGWKGRWRRVSSFVKMQKPRDYKARTNIHVNISGHRSIYKCLAIVCQTSFTWTTGRAGNGSLGESTSPVQWQPPLSIICLSHFTFMFSSWTYIWNDISTLGLTLLSGLRQSVYASSVHHKQLDGHATSSTVTPSWMFHVCVSVCSF